MATGQHDVEYQSERARDDDLVLRKLGHRDVQCLAGIGHRGVERDTLDGSLRLNGAQRLFAVAWKEVGLHSHSIYVFLKFNICIMAEGGYDPMDTPTGETPLIPDTGDDDDDTNLWDNPDQYQVTDEGEVVPTDSTQPFEPGAASTPAGEQVPMSTRTRLPQEQGPRTAETSFITGDTQGQRVRTMQENVAWREVSEEFPLADTSKLDMRYKVAPRAGGSGGGAIIEVKMSGKDKWYRLYTKSRGASSKSFNDHLPKEIKSALGKSLDEQFIEMNTLFDKNEQERQAKQKQKEQIEPRAGEEQKLRRDMDAMRNRIKDDDDRIRELEDAHGPLKTEEIQRLKDEKRALESDHQFKRQQLSQLQKNAKQANKIQKEIDKLMLDNRGLAERLDELRTKKDAIKPLDELKQNQEELERQIEDDKRVIADENTTSSQRADAEARVADNEAELARVNTEIEVRERQRPLLERVKEIFKKYGWTLQVVVLAAGITTTAVVLATLNGLKAATKALGNGRQTGSQRPSRHHRLDREFHLQSCRAGHLLSCRTRLAAHTCRGGLPG